MLIGDKLIFKLLTMYKKKQRGGMLPASGSYSEQAAVCHLASKGWCSSAEVSEISAPPY